MKNWIQRTKVPTSWTLITIAFASQLTLFIYLKSWSHSGDTHLISKPSSMDTTPADESLTDDVSPIDLEYARSRYFNQRGTYTVLTNYVQGTSNVPEYETVTLVTHATVDYLGNISTLVQFWFGPISLTVYAPGPEFHLVLSLISILRTCPESSVTSAIKSRVSFHIFFETQFLPELGSGYNFYDLGLPEVNCTDQGSLTGSNFRHENRLLYPINVARNIGREMARSHFVLVSDIELLPNPPELIPKFLDLIRRRVADGKPRSREVFVLPPFEVSRNLTLSMIPRSKPALERLLHRRRPAAVPFHYYACFRCHLIPQYGNWTRHRSPDGTLNIHHSSQYVTTSAWEPFYIGTRLDPPFDEGFYRENALNKVIQAAILCHMNYTFHILDTAYLIHTPGFKYGKTYTNSWLKWKAIRLAREEALPRQFRLYGHSIKGCWQVKSKIPVD